MCGERAQVRTGLRFYEIENIAGMRDHSADRNYLRNFSCCFERAFSAVFFDYWKIFILRKNSLRNETTVGNSKRERVLLYSKYSKCMNKQSIFGAIDWGLLSVFCLNSEIKYIQIGF